ncbi:MAG: conjugal transfer protein TraN, partial [Ketobacter sp.]|nr:conjugal transfer protein TraN [Ketobacter sp.]
MPDGADALIAIDIPMLFADDLYGLSTDFYVNDRLVYTYKGTNKDRCGPWDECISNPNPGRIVLSPPLPTPDGNVAFSQIIRLGNQSTSSKNWWTPSTSPVQLVWGKTTYDITWKKQCPALIPQCKPQKKRCTEGKETRNIDGVSVTLDCWKYQTTYQCDLPDTCQSLPKDCVNSTTQCSLKQNGTCVEEEVTKLCQEEHCR